MKIGSFPKQGLILSFSFSSFFEENKNKEKEDKIYSFVA